MNLNTTRKMQVREPGSFRDPSGYIFAENGKLYRQVSLEYREDFDYLIGSGLHNELVARGLLNPHTEMEAGVFDIPGAYKILCPRVVEFISYPYEWCFSQLKDAALVTLEIEKLALDYGMTLKDSSAYNIQFVEGKPLLIDTLSFRHYVEGKPWVAYRQFCQHFLAPLALMTLKDVRLGQLLRNNIDGVPLDLTSRLLPQFKSFRTGLLLHLHLHALTQRRYADRPVNDNIASRKFSKRSFYGLIESLHDSVERLHWEKGSNGWRDYYTKSEIDSRYLEHKRTLVADYVEQVKPSSAWDIGSNTGMFSRIVAQKGIPVVSFDSDTGCVEENYLKTKRNKETNILPLLADFTDPSPALGWENKERKSILDRGPVDIAMALALIHHLAIGNNLPMVKIASFFQKICKWLIIEFVPKSDPMVKKLLRVREDIFYRYKQEDFESDFGQFFHIKERQQIGESQRSLYLLKSKDTVK